MRDRGKLSGLPEGEPPKTLVELFEERGQFGLDEVIRVFYQTDPDAMDDDEYAWKEAGAQFLLNLLRELIASGVNLGVARSFGSGESEKAEPRRTRTSRRPSAFRR